MRSLLFLLVLVPPMIGCGNTEEAGVAEGVDEPPETPTAEFEKGEAEEQPVEE